MGMDALEIGVQIRKFLIVSIKTCYRSVCNHPFLLGTVLFLIFLYNSFPFVFSLLVSSSPVLVCTAILLGALLSFGQPNIPEIEKEEKIRHEVASLKVGLSEDATVVDRYENSAVERFIEKRRDIVERAIEEASLLERDDSSFDNAPLIDGNLREIQCEKRVTEDVEKKIDKPEFEQRRDIDERAEDEGVFGNQKAVGNLYLLVEEVGAESLEVENNRSLGEPMDAHPAHQLDSSPRLAWNHDDHDESLDSGSDGAESSSPDASMADIIPMLDELHPLLDSEAPQPSHEDFGAASVQSDKSNVSSDESDDQDTDNHEEEDGEDDNNDDDDDDEEEEEEDTQEGKEDNTKSAITWTEDDQKNLMDLGTSELERNQRLENLIARRRARKNLRMVAEKNLIDLESSDLHFSVAPISTTRRNPFDIPYDSFDSMGLPPIPGSAPSILLPRRNPFDLPYDSNEEKPDLTGDNFHQEFTGFHQKDALFRRHESFSLGPSLLGVPRQSRQDIKLRPYFMPERMISEETGHPSFQRQLSELSDSKASSVPETESMSSVADQEDKKFTEPYLSLDAEVISSQDQASDHVEHGSQSSEDVDLVEVDHLKKRDTDIDNSVLKDHHEVESSLYVTGGLSLPLEVGVGEIHLTKEVIGEERSSRSSSSILSEVSEETFLVKENEGSPTPGREKGDANGSDISVRPLPEESDIKFSSVIIDGSDHKEPVYDSSPPAHQKYLSSSSTSSDLRVETSGMDSSSLSAETPLLSSAKESEAYNKSAGNEPPINDDMLADSSQLEAVNETESRSGEAEETCEEDAIKLGNSGFNRNSGYPIASLMLESIVEHVSNISDQEHVSSFSSLDSSENKGRALQHEVDQIHSSSSDADSDVDPYVAEEADTMASSKQHVSYEGLILSAPEQQQPSSAVEQGTVARPLFSSPETESVEEHSMDEEESFQCKQDNVLEEQLSVSKRSLVEPSSDDHEELQETSTIMAHSIEEMNISSNEDVRKVIVPEDKVSSNSFTRMPDHTSISSEDTKNLKEGRNCEVDDENHRRIPGNIHYVAETIDSHVGEELATEDADGINEIDEGLLSELDTIGDFSVKETGSNMDEIEKNLGADQENILVQYDVESKFIEGVEDDYTEVKGSEAFVDPEIQAASAFEENPRNHELIESASELHLPTSGASSSVYGDSSFRESIHEEVESSTNVQSIQEETMPRKTEVEFPDSEVLIHDIATVELNSGMPIIQARSADDIDAAFKKTEKRPQETEIEPVQSEIANQDSITAVIESEMPVVEARSLEDIDFVFKKICEEESQKPDIVESQYAEVMHETKDSNLEKANMEVPVLEARSIENIDLDFRRLQRGVDAEEAVLLDSADSSLTVLKPKDSVEVVEVRTLEGNDKPTALERNLDRLTDSLETKEGLAEVEVKAMGSTNEIESTSKEYGVEENSPSVAEKPDHVVDSLEDPGLSVSKVRGKKEKSHKSSSSSGSSSSSSDSD